MKEMERRYQDRWNVNMMADFRWMLKRESVDNSKSANETRFTDLLMTKGFDEKKQTLMKYLSVVRI